MSRIVWPVVPAGMVGGELLPHLSARARTEMIDMVFHEIGGFPAFADWARTERTEFYRMYARGAVKSTNVELTSNISPEDIIARLDAGEHARVISPDPQDEAA